MDDTAVTLITIGALLLLGLFTHILGRRTPLPRVTFLLIFGFLIGPSVFDLLPDLHHEWFPLVTNLALVMVGFLLGEKLTPANLREHGREVLTVSIVLVVVTAVMTWGGLVLLGVPVVTALILAGIAPATDPAATLDVIREKQADGPLARVLQGIVAVDDAWGIIVFSLLFTLAGIVSGQGNGATTLLQGAWELGGAILLGILLGVPMAYATGRIQPGEPTLVEALGAVFLCGGIALALHVSFLLAAMTMGAVIANLARHHTSTFSAIEGIEWPFLVLFFLLSGASVERGALQGIGLAAIGYIVLRTVSRIAGAWLGGHLGRVERAHRRWTGAALLPQAGVALGLALVAGQRLGEAGEVIITITVFSTIFFEIVGPVLTRLALGRVGEIRARDGIPGETPAGTATD